MPVVVLAAIGLAQLAPAAVSAQVPPAQVDVIKTVYVGRDDGAGCPGLHTIVTEAPQQVTFCFEVTNTGANPLAPVTLSDTVLGIDQTDMVAVGGGPAEDALASLDPGETATVYYETSVTESVQNVVDATGVAVDDQGAPLDGVDPATDQDGALVAVASLSLAKTVYAGVDGGASCPGDEQVTGLDGDELTYCFEITNTGDTTLAPVSLDDVDLALSDQDMTVVSGSLASLAPGDTVVLAVDGVVDGELTNHAFASGVPVDQGGDPIVPGVTVIGGDTADVHQLGAELTIDKTAYRGHDDGAGCPGVDEVQAVHGADVTYCFEITNSGDTRVDDVTVDDADLGVTDADMTLLSGDLDSLEPGDSAVLFAETTVDGDLTNTATVSATAVDDAGDPIVGIGPITAEDTAAVDEVDAVLALVTEVQDPYTGNYLDADSDEGTGGTNDPAAAVLVAGDTAHFRFRLLNGGGADITDVVVSAPGCDAPPVLSDGDLGEPDILEPDEEWVFTCDVAEVSAGFTLEASADGDIDGIEPDGAGDIETASVELAAIDLTATVLDPTSDNFVDTAVLHVGDDATFQILVKDTGEVPLANLHITAPQAPDCDRDLTDVLAAGDALATYECTVTGVTDGFVNTVDATATPVDDAGAQTADEVTDESMAVVQTTANAASTLAIDKTLSGIDQSLQEATWTIAVGNAGATAATDPIVVIDQLPAELDYLSAQGDGWTCEPAPEGVRCATDQDLEPGSQTSVDLTTKVLAAPGTTVTNTASLEDGTQTASADAVLVTNTDVQDPNAPQTPNSLARTGADIGGLLAAAALLITAGTFLAWNSRRRNT